MGMETVPEAEAEAEAIRNAPMGSAMPLNKRTHMCARRIASKQAPRNATYFVGKPTFACSNSSAADGRNDLKSASLMT
jgi:hypothetical protein